MELIESIRESLVEQSEAQGKPLYPSTNRKYITESLHWVRTKEGYLFWHILNTSYKSYDTYDYITIFKLYKLYGDEVFKLIIQLNYDYYDDYYDYETNTLSTEGFEYLCKQIEENGIIRKH